MDDMSDENWKKFQPKLKEWFKENILDQFTVGNTSNTDDWLRWNKEAQLSLFQERKYDEKLHKSICNFLQPYLDVMYSQKTNNNTKTDDLENGIKELNKKISKLKEERKKLIYEQKKLKQQTNNNTF